MATLSYSFRPSLFAAVRTVLLDDTGLAVRSQNGAERRFAWADVTEVHIEPATTPDEGRRFVVHVKARTQPPIDIDSVNVRGGSDFEHKTDEFIAVLQAIHEALAARKAEVRFRYGARRGIVTAWRIALVMLAATGIFGTVAAIIAEEYEALTATVPFVGFGLSGLAVLRGRKGAVAYDPSGFAVEARQQGPAA